MRAITMRETGDPHVLAIEEVPDPAPAAGEVVVRNQFAGVNFGDVIRRRRGGVELTPDQPCVLGFEAIGQIAATGKGVHSFKPGETVAYLTTGSAYAELTGVAADQVIRVPPSVAPAAIATSMCVGTTAWHLLRLSGADRGHTALIHGAGGVSAALLQLARTLGTRMIATAGSAEKANYATACGADLVIRRDQQDFAESVLEATAGRGVDMVFDGVGDATADGNATCLKQHGRWMYFGSAGGGHAAFPGMSVLSKGLRIDGFVIFHVLEDLPRWKRGAEAVASALEQGILRPSVQVFPAEQVRRVHARLEAGKILGRASLDMRRMGS